MKVYDDFALFILHSTRLHTFHAFLNFLQDPVE
jgi:hypothetical protein